CRASTTPRTSRSEMTTCSTSSTSTSWAARAAKKADVTPGRSCPVTVTRTECGCISGVVRWGTQAGQSRLDQLGRESRNGISHLPKVTETQWCDTDCESGRVRVLRTLTGAGGGQRVARHRWTASRVRLHLEPVGQFGVVRLERRPLR